MSIDTELSYVKKMVEKDAAGYVTKNSSIDEMIDTIITTQQGETNICPTIENK